MEYTVKTLAQLAGVTPRTLRWYDKEGLLKPLRTTDAGYRIYGPEQVDRLQMILFYRELGMELSAIRSILNDPSFDRISALQNHLTELETRRDRLDTLILTVQSAITEAKGGTQMSDSKKFEAFKRSMIQNNETQYGREIREKYGDEAIDRSNEKVLSMTQEDYSDVQSLEHAIYSALTEAVRSGISPTGKVGLSIAELHRKWLSYYWKTYTPQAHAGLAQMYVLDERFTAYYDKEEPGCAAFLRDAILAYTNQ
jgi:DNA-binding transcriptional MerR regulator